jgi:hypothetical protein
MRAGGSFVSAAVLSLALMAPSARADDNAGAAGNNAGADVVQPRGTELEPAQRGAISAERPRYELHPTPDGGYIYHGHQFGARIHRDGSVTFIGATADFPPDGTDPATVGIDAVTPQDPISGDIPIAVESRPGIRFDATDEYLRLLGKDPAKQEKTMFLAATFDLRMRMTARVRDADRRVALAELPGRLEEVWSDPRFSEIERRHLLLAMWNDLAPGPDGAPARAVMRKFVDAHLLPGEAALFR